MAISVYKPLHKYLNWKNNFSRKNDKSFDTPTTSISEGFLGAALSLFTPEMNGTDYEEEQFRRKMMRKKKTRKKRKL